MIFYKIAWAHSEYVTEDIHKLPNATYKTTGSDQLVHAVTPKGGQNGPRVTSIWLRSRLVDDYLYHYPVSILHKSIADRYRPVRVADGPITVRYRFM